MSSVIRKTLEAKLEVGRQLQKKMVEMETSKKRTIDRALTETEKTSVEPVAKRLKTKEAPETPLAATQEIILSQDDDKPEPLPNLLVVHPDGDIELLFVDPKAPIGNIRGRALDEPVDFKKDVELVKSSSFGIHLDIFHPERSWQLPKKTTIQYSCLKQEDFEGTEEEKPHIFTDRRVLVEDKDGDMGEDQEPSTYYIFGPIFFFIGINHVVHPRDSIPLAFIDRIRDTANGVKWLRDNRPDKGILAHRACDNYKFVVSFVTVLSSTFGSGDEALHGPTRLLHCLLPFLPLKYGEDLSQNQAASEVSGRFQCKLFDALSDRSKDIDPQSLGYFFAFLGERRVPFSRDAVCAYNVTPDNSGISSLPVQAMVDLFHDFQSETYDNKFVLAHRQTDDDEHPDYGIRGFSLRQLPNLAYKNTVSILLY